LFITEVRATGIEKTNPTDIAETAVMIDIVAAIMTGGEYAADT
jgi:hypothetical protein